MSWLYDIHQKTYERLVIPEAESILWTASKFVSLRKAEAYFAVMDEEKAEDCRERLNEITTI